jgi:hypothetical protein
MTSFLYNHVFERISFGRCRCVTVQHAYIGGGGGGGGVVTRIP